MPCLNFSFTLDEADVKEYIYIRTYEHPCCVASRPDIWVYFRSSRLDTKGGQLAQRAAKD